MPPHIATNFGVMNLRLGAVVVNVVFLFSLAVFIASRLDEHDMALKADIRSIILAEFKAKARENTQRLSANTCKPSPSLVDNGDNCLLRRSGKLGGLGQQSQSTIASLCGDPLSYHVCDDLEKFTGLTKEEVNTRLRRLKRFHFSLEHQFWDPQSPTELRWYYLSSVSYLFANALHLPPVVKYLKRKLVHEPVLDYSAGVGANVIHVAKKGMRAHYFGIGQFEMLFAKYRVAKKGVSHLVSFVEPWVNGTTLDPIHAITCEKEKYGTILLFDVLEHIPNYHLTLAHLIACLRPGGTIIEHSPFDSNGGPQDIHLKASMPMAEAMGSSMKSLEKYVWEKKLE